MLGLVGRPAPFLLNDIENGIGRIDAVEHRKDAFDIVEHVALTAPDQRPVFTKQTRDNDPASDFESVM